MSSINSQDILAHSEVYFVIWKGMLNIEIFFREKLLYCTKIETRIARPTDVHVHYNHGVSPSVRVQLVKMLITLEPHGIF